MTDQYVVAVFELDRRYGGPEEGGWWYDTGTLVRILRTASTAARADALASRANSLLAWQRANRPREWRMYPLGSMCYDGGHYVADVYLTRELPTSFPAQRPRYE